MSSDKYEIWQKQCTILNKSMKTLLVCNMLDKAVLLNNALIRIKLRSPSFRGLAFPISHPMIFFQMANTLKDLKFQVYMAKTLKVNNAVLNSSVGAIL